VTERNYLQCSAIYTEPPWTTRWSCRGNQALCAAEQQPQRRGRARAPLPVSQPPDCWAPHRDIGLLLTPEEGPEDHPWGPPRRIGAPCAARVVHCTGFHCQTSGDWVEPTSGLLAFGVEVPSGGSGQRVFCSGIYLLEADLSLSLPYRPFLMFISK